MSPIEFNELKNDTNFTNSVNNLTNSLNDIEESIRTAVNFKNCDELSVEDRVKYDLYLSYTINSLYWMYTKLQGIDSNSHGIKNELSRVRQSMLRDKQIYERKTIRPVLDKGAAGRFVKHGLYDRTKRNQEEQNRRAVEGQAQGVPLNKKIRFAENDSD